MLHQQTPLVFLNTTFANGLFQSTLPYLSMDMRPDIMRYKAQPVCDREYLPCSYMGK